MFSPHVGRRRKFSPILRVRNNTLKTWKSWSFLSYREATNKLFLRFQMRVCSQSSFKILLNIFANFRKFPYISSNFSRNFFNIPTVHIVLNNISQSYRKYFPKNFFFYLHQNFLNCFKKVPNISYKYLEIFSKVWQTFFWSFFKVFVKYLQIFH